MRGVPYPYGVTYHRGSLYLIGWAPEHEEIRHWKVDRMEKAEVTKFPFRRPDDFDLDEHLANSFGVFHGDGEDRIPLDLLAPSARLDALVMLPAYIDFWRQTSPRPAPDPDVSLFLHGQQRCAADVQVCWRGDLIDKDGMIPREHWRHVVSLVPPTPRPPCRWLVGSWWARSRIAGRCCVVTWRTTRTVCCHRLPSTCKRRKRRVRWARCWAWRAWPPS